MKRVEGDLSKSKMEINKLLSEQVGQKAKAKTLNFKPFPSGEVLDGEGQILREGQWT